MGFYWPSSEQKRVEILTVKRNDPAVFESVYQCNPGAREGGIFIDEYFKKFTPPDGIEFGIANSNVATFCAKGHSVVQAWDTAWDAKSTNDYSVCVTALLVPCTSYHRNEDPDELGACEPHFDVLILDVYRERLAWGDLPEAFRRQAMKWQPEAVIIEKKQSGIGLFQTMQSSGFMNLIGVTPQESKRARVLMGSGAGSVQGWFKLHRVLTADDQPWYRAYKVELKDFTGDKTGKDDQVDATAHLVTYAIELGANTPMFPTEWSPERVDEIMALPKMPGTFAEVSQLQQGDAAAVLNFIGMMPELSFDPFASSCGRCKHHDGERDKLGNRKDGKPVGYCSVQGRRTANIDSCISFQPLRRE